MSKKFYKTKVVVEILHEGPIEFDNLGNINDMITNGDCSGAMTVEASELLTGKQMADEAIKQHSSPEFFGLEEDGTKIG